MKNLMLVAAGIVMAAGMATAHAGDVDAGQAKFAGSGCVGCHGAAGQGQAIFPKVAGKEADYLVETLGKYRAGEAVGPNSAMMMPHAMNLSDDDIANLAAYMASLE
ncbi:MAG: c-type cytochrome [Thioalkalivibrio sp.]|nr:c-type cytochrome [Thioalkalivibrio sp.]